MTDRTPPPADLADNGRSLWLAVLGEYELERHEELLLAQACRTVDLLDALAARVAADGEMLDGRVHPAVVEARQQRIALARLVAALRLPSGDEGDQAGARRPQRRVGARGVYAIRGSAS